jgi:PPOX class probable F420-dependent enzyme
MPLDRRVREFIDSQRVARLATIDDRARPHIVPICFALVDDRLYSVIDEKPKRSEPTRLRRLLNMEANPHVQVLFDHYDDEDWAQLRFVQVRGEARVLYSDGEYERALKALRGRYKQYEDMALDGRPVIVVDVDALVSWPA